MEAEARGGRDKARVLFTCGFFGGVLVFSVIFCLVMGGGGGVEVSNRCWSCFFFVCCDAVGGHSLVPRKKTSKVGNSGVSLRLK